ncbi:HPP family protein [Amycolatopsis vancoresmycina]|uniref:Putative signal-transduction protein containing cAMP-binding and CBS domains n=1 Tax=Amycolatopsis vancoresmycina DSM 44592 TaxID=1292037 RepID=R1GE73_9PSEU|nr:CBS domain-containing protein [Amycolatopsis vancoresmycina]EOD69602.1 putative signal-transduction protein containing cAMP-binding and CBS domains [Amycolatopsis vancoresmycina DSM 44592]
MKARDIMTRPVVRVRPATPVREAIVLLTEHCVAALPVVDEDDAVLGVFTEADALRSGLTGGAPDVLVATMMTAPAETVRLDTDISEIARRMLGDRRRSIPVVDDEGVLAGIVSRRDMLSPLVRQDDSIASHLNALLTDYSGNRDRWAVSVTGGMVTIRGAFADEAERRVVAALAKTVCGVVGVELGEEASVRT